MIGYPYVDCKGGPGTTEPACGACVTCLLRAIDDLTAKLEEMSDQANALIVAGDALDEHSSDACHCIRGRSIPCNRCIESSNWRKAKEAFTNPI